MAKLFIQSMPTEEEFRNSATRWDFEADVDALYTNFLFSKVASEIEKGMENYLAPHNLSSGRFTILALLNEESEGLMPSDLSNRTGVTQATMSGLIASLEKAELVRREAHKSDARSSIIKITEKGEGVLKQIFPQWSPQVSAFWKIITPEERIALTAILEKIVKATAPK